MPFIFFANIGCIYSKEQIIFLMGEKCPSKSHHELSFTITLVLPESISRS